ncbi:MAG: hypothetical protein LBK00_07510 [Treponema sp.]|nr:hypothetical protein [Treponema sp.]
MRVRCSCPLLAPHTLPVLSPDHETIPRPPVLYATDWDVLRQDGKALFNAGDKGVLARLGFACREASEQRPDPPGAGEGFNAAMLRDDYLQRVEWIRVHHSFPTATALDRGGDSCSRDDCGGMLLRTDGAYCQPVKGQTPLQNSGKPESMKGNVGEKRVLT